MDLLVFDLDGTLLNKQQRLSAKTIQVLERLSLVGVYYTIATGRTHQATAPCISGHAFPIWQIYKNGVQWWHPIQRIYRHEGILNFAMIKGTIKTFAEHQVTPFIFCIAPSGKQSVFFPPLADQYAHQVYNELSEHAEIELKPLSELPHDAQITNISALGHPTTLADIVNRHDDHEQLIAYSGGGIYQPHIHWIDIHHNSASKGSAITALKTELSACNLIVFGDGDNDLPMFRVADESYATGNASDIIKERATGIIGHHNEDGVAEFLLRRYGL